MIDMELFRFAVFAVLLLIMAGWEYVTPYRDAGQNRRSVRWLTNFGLMAGSAVLGRFSVGAAMILGAQWAQDQGWGLFHLVAFPGWIAALISIAVLDAAVYWQHRLTHIVPLFWRFHRVHHCDLAFDVSTAVRFHPIEIMASAIYKSAFVVMLGADPWVVVVYETLLSGFALFNHGNVHLPPRLDRVVRVLFVTPDMHRVHHSIETVETNSNYGNILSVWDRVFASYRAKTRINDHDMPIGLEQFRDDGSQSLWGTLLLPFRRS
ncbi:MAG: sterol desaturase family protein [Pseudomonadota bacterium]